MQGASWNDLRAISSKLVEYSKEVAAVQEALVADDLGLVNKLYWVCCQTPLFFARMVLVT